MREALQDAVKVLKWASLPHQAGCFSLSQPVRGKERHITCRDRLALKPLHGSEVEGCRDRSATLVPTAGNLEPRHRLPTPPTQRHGCLPARQLVGASMSRSTCVRTPEAMQNKSPASIHEVGAGPVPLHPYTSPHPAHSQAWLPRLPTPAPWRQQMRRKCCPLGCMMLCRRH